MASTKKKGKPDEVQVRISKDLRRRANVYAADKERDLREILDEAIEEYLKNHAKKTNGA